MSVKLAIPMFRDSVAPRFETAESFLICLIEDKVQRNSDIVACARCAGIGRIRLLQDNHVRILICNGIKKFYRDLLASLSIDVIDNISMTIDEALQFFLSGDLLIPVDAYNTPDETCTIPHDDMVCWAKDYFESHGYQVAVLSTTESVLIDLIAYMTCPLCGKPVRVAVCCGAQVYRTDVEIRAFHHVVSSQYNAAVYIHPTSTNIEETCRSFGIQFLDPCEDLEDWVATPTAGIPILRHPISGHEAAMNEGGMR